MCQMVELRRPRVVAQDDADDGWRQVTHAPPSLTFSVLTLTCMPAKEASELGVRGSHVTCGGEMTIGAYVQALAEQFGITTFALADERHWTMVHSEVATLVTVAELRGHCSGTDLIGYAPGLETCRNGHHYLPELPSLRSVALGGKLPRGTAPGAHFVCRRRRAGRLGLGSDGANPPS
jgi:hypothetical protein